MIHRVLASGLSALFLGACQHNTPTVPAVLVDASEETMAAVKAHLADAMGVGMVTLGAGDPTGQSQVSVLPPPLGEHETRSPAAPTQFNLLMIGEACYAERVDTGEKTELTGVRCRAL
ncbi:MAG: hypothetical protein NXH78_16615 [Hyphomonadaceae bacterium]|nr:hypothetical protein [Hyphomonadaceae bacterium]